MFIPLRVHSVYSKGKGGATLEELAFWAFEKRLPSAALTDMGNLYGWGGWKRAASQKGFAPLFGCEIELQRRQFLFLVKSREGYWNLMEIFNQKKIKETEGLVVIFFPQSREEKSLEDFHLPLGMDFYVGADFFNFKKALTWSQSYDLPLVWANPLKFVKNPERLILLHSIQKKIPFPPEKDKLKNKVKLFGPDQEVLAIKQFSSEVKEAFKKTFEIAAKCRFSFEDIVPPLPEGLFSTTLREVVMAKLRNLRDLSWKERQRAKRELSIVGKSGFAPYFLIVYDVVQFARKNGILHNLKGS